MGKRLIEVDEYISRGGGLISVFVADDDDWRRVVEWCEHRRSVYFGEIAGKHSDVRITFELKDFKVLTEDQGFIEKFVEIVGACVGHSILGHMTNRCEECGEEMDDSEGAVCSECKGLG